MKKNIISIVLMLTVLLSSFALTANAETTQSRIFNRNSINLYPTQIYKLFLSDTKNISLTTSDKNIATVENDGTVTAIRKGTAVITAKTSDGNTEKCNVNVLEGISPQSISLNTQSITLKEGSGKKLTASVLPENVSNKSIRYSSSDSSVASVDNKGYIKAIKEGVAVITAESSSSAITKKCIVNVRSKSGNDDFSVTVSGTVYELSGEKAPNKKIELKNSKDLFYAESDNNGQFEFYNVEQGNYTISVYKSDNADMPSASATVIVSSYNMNISCIINSTELVLLYQDEKISSKDIKDITLNKSSIILDKGEEYDMTYKIRPSNIGTPTLVGSSSNKKVATVNSDGKITAVSEGKATISFSTLDGRMSKSCIVTVTDNNRSTYSWLIIIIEALILAAVIGAFTYSYKKFLRHKEHEEMRRR
ncbi:MAG: Ig domain-containing protein [Acutalibacteraceae bacterium]